MSTPEELLDQLENKGYFIWDNFLESHTTKAISESWNEKIQNAELKKAGIGRADNYQVDAGERGDFIFWISKENTDEFVKTYLEKIEALITDLNRSFFLGIRDYECHFALYPVGTRYARHVDRHRSGSSRIVSFVFYLNENWHTEDGGHLCIYENDELVEKILPAASRLVVFLSEKEHEVLTTNRSRASITGWMLNK